MKNPFEGAPEEIDANELPPEEVVIPPVHEIPRVAEAPDEIKALQEAIREAKENE